MATSAFEYVPDILIHTFEALAPDSLDEVALVANVGRAVQAGRSYWTGKSTIPTPANFVDVYNHALNIKHRIENISFFRNQALNNETNKVTESADNSMKNK